METNHYFFMTFPIYSARDRTKMRQMGHCPGMKIEKHSSEKSFMLTAGFSGGSWERTSRAALQYQPSKVCQVEVLND